MAQPDYPLAGAEGLTWAVASGPDRDSDFGEDDDSAAAGRRRPGAAHGTECACSQCQTFRSGMEWADSIRPRYAASGLPQVQQHTDPNNQPDPEGDELPAGVAFPLGDNAPGSTFRQQWSTGPDGPQPRTGVIRSTAYSDMSSDHASLQGHADARAGKMPVHKDEFGASKQKHRRYLESWDDTAGLIHGLVGRAPMSQAEYAGKTGRPDMHSHYLSAYAQGRVLHGQSNSLYRADAEGQTTASLRVQADAWSQPRQTTDDFNPPFNSEQTSPDPWSQQQSSDFQAGVSAGQSDRGAGERPLFADNSSTVSPYVKGYAQGYGAAGSPPGPQDVPLSMGGDSGQAQNAGEAQRAFQVARASRTASAQDAWKDARDNLERQHQVEGGRPVSGAPGDEKLEGEGTGGRGSATWRVSASFAPAELMRDPDFAKAYKYAHVWEPGVPLVKKGSAQFEAGLYAGITDQPRKQQAWLAEHARHASAHPELARRIGLHESFTRKQASRAPGLGRRGAYLVKRAGTMTDLITDGPGTSPDPMGSTPLNGPGAPPPMGGLSDPAQAGGAPPYQGAPPLPGGPVVPDDVMGSPQQQPQPGGPTVQTYSGMHPENALLAPAAPGSADQSGYTNRDAYRGDPRGGDRLAAFRNRVQAGLAQMGAR